MKKLFTVQVLLLIYALVLTSCSEKESVEPNSLSPVSLAATKWTWVSWGGATGDETKLNPQNPVYIHFIDGSQIERTYHDERGQLQLEKLNYEVSKDTLVAYETKQANYFLLTEHTATDLTLHRVKYKNLTTNEVSPVQSEFFKYKKAAN